MRSSNDCGRHGWATRQPVHRENSKRSLSAVSMQTVHATSVYSECERALAISYLLAFQSQVIWSKAMPPRPLPNFNTACS